MAARVSQPSGFGRRRLLDRSDQRRSRAAFAVVAAQIVAFWPVWWDYFRRLRGGVDEPWGLLALATGIVLLWIRRSESDGSRFGASLSIPASIPALLFGITHQRLPPLAEGILAVTALSLTFSRLIFNRTLHLGLFGLLLLSLPLSSALQFYLGYPMRCATAALAAPLLRLSGFAVSRAGTVLHFGDQYIWVDAPCSGVKMLWTGLFLGLALAAFNRLGNRRTVVVALAALLAIVLGNVLRSSALFYAEAGIVHAPAWAHTAVGLVAFGLTAVAILWTVLRLARPIGMDDERTTTQRRHHSKAGITFHVLACSVVAILPLSSPKRLPASAAADLATFPGWPPSFEGRPLVAQPLSAREQIFLTDFPGRVAKFTDGRRQFVLRWTSVPTRKLHLSSDCFRGAGFAIVPRPALAAPAASGVVQYSRFSATRGSESLLVSERICDDAGHSWPDASSWYWSAAFNPASGPWWAVTIVESAADPN
jgi:exosortase